MPEYCPLRYTIDCHECWENVDGYCSFAKKSINQILTTEERLDWIERQLPLPSPPPRDELNQLKNKVLYLQNKTNEHIDKSKQKGKIRHKIPFKGIKVEQP